MGGSPKQLRKFTPERKKARRLRTTECPVRTRSAWRLLFQQRTLAGHARRQALAKAFMAA
jgi:hypothetical protein